MAEHCTNSLGLVSFVTWALLLIGWYAVHRATLRRERRKEKREMAHQICGDLRAMEREAIDFHTSPNYESRNSYNIRQEVERLIRQLQREPLSELAIPTHRLIGLRQSITRNNIDLTDFVSRPVESDLVRNIHNAVIDLIESIENRREQCWK